MLDLCIAAFLSSLVTVIVLLFVVGPGRTGRFFRRSSSRSEEGKQTYEALRNSEKMYREIVDHASVGIYRTSVDGKMIYVNRALSQMLEFESPEDQLAHTAFDSYQNPEDRKAWIEELRAKGRIVNRELNFVTKTGQLKHVLASGTLEGEVLSGMIIDISELKKAQERLVESEERYRSAIENSNEGIAIIRGDTHLFVNPKFLAIFGYERPEEVIGKSVLPLVHPDDRERVGQVVTGRQAGKEVPASYEFRGLKKDGEFIDIEVSATNITYMGDTAALAFLRDVTERKRVEKEITYLSFHDKLTDLYNRAFFEEELERLETRRQMPLSLIMGDVNGLKFVNDVWGHQEGDKMLVKIAQILKSCCRSDDIIARWGGDEFVILLPRTDKPSAAGVAKRIREACAEMTGESFQLSIALGVATKEEVGHDTDSVLKEAEDLMYRNKLMEDRSSRSSTIFSLRKTLSERSHETEEHAGRLRTMALELGRAVELSDSHLDELALLALLHDIGKVVIRDDILGKPGTLTPEEWDIMKTHTEVGWRIARSSHELGHIADAILSHHEQWDGKGYPKGMKGKQIPLIARILAIVDSYDVMTNERPYKKAISREEGLEEIQKCAGTQFDPELVKVFVRLLSDRDSPSLSAKTRGDLPKIHP